MDIVTLIPAFKPQYLVDLLNALRLQTRPSSRIVFSDDTPDGRYRHTLFSDAFAPLREGLPIECHDGPRAGAWANFRHLLDLWDGASELVHLLLDDDVLYPTFYERHLAAHAAADLSCSVSARWTASETGVPLALLPIPAVVSGHPQRMLALDAGVVFATTAAECRNWFGEFSNAVFRRPHTALLRDVSIGGVSYAGLWDLGAFMDASLRAPVGWIQEPLGYFRTGRSNNSSQVTGPYVKGAHLAYAALAIGGRRAGLYSEAQVATVCATLAAALVQRFPGQEDVQAFVPVLQAVAAGGVPAEDGFLVAWTAFLQRHGF